MLTRQKILLRLIKENTDGCSKLCLAKMSFLLSEEGRSEQLKTFYEFVPYKFGPYSFAMAHELKTLEKEGFVESTDGETLILLKKGRLASQEAVEPRLARDIELLQEHYGKLNQSQLISLVYEKHPWFTANSQFLNKRKAKVAATDCANYTVGYQSFQVDGLLNVLLKSGIRTLVDTRNNPVSRRYGFHKSSLSKLSELLGIEYLHYAQVGIPSSWRQELETQEQFKLLFQKYENEVLAAQKKTVKELASITTDRPTVLLCREAEPAQCHRTALAKALNRINQLPIVDLNQRETEKEEIQIKFNRIIL